MKFFVLLPERTHRNYRQGKYADRGFPAAQKLLKHLELHNKNPFQFCSYQLKGEVSKTNSTKIIVDIPDFGDSPLKFCLFGFVE